MKSFINMITTGNNNSICLGIMSGTSLDGLDLCLVSFSYKLSWEYSIIEATTLPYDNTMRNNLTNAENLSSIELLLLNNEFGTFIGTKAKEFYGNTSFVPEFIASHGHTIFHQTNKGVTYQIGSGSNIAAKSGLPVVSDFRSLDVALGGQGAPLVPIGDELLFSQYDYCLNLGGFANISTTKKGARIAFDICPVNIVLNNYTRKIGKEFDDKGEIAQDGAINVDLLYALNSLSFYSQNAPKSLGKEWVFDVVLPIIDSFELSVPDILRTFCEHIAFQITKCVEPGKTILVTGGGAYNRFLISLFSEKSNATIIIPDDNTIQFKEALIFAFLGLLRIRGEINCLQSVTGASKDSIGGAVYLG